MATNANEILDRLAALLDAANPCFHSDCEARTYSALLNAAPALIRLARLALEIHPDYLCHVGTRDRDHAIKALGEVRL